MISHEIMAGKVHVDPSELAADCVIYVEAGDTIV